jgi:hypothetical protein
MKKKTSFKSTTKNEKRGGEKGKILERKKEEPWEMNKRSTKEKQPKGEIEKKKEERKKKKM